MQVWQKHSFRLGVALFVIATLLASWKWLYHGPEYNRIYDSYYQHFYKAYISTYSPPHARLYADHYARYYAEYYTSPSYAASLRYALPEATPDSLSYPPGPIADLRTSDSGIKALKDFEGFRPRPYRDVGGKLTIGYGHLMRRGSFYTELGKTEAENLLREDIRVAEAVLKRHVQVKLSQHQFDALVSLIYNIGPGQFAESTLLRKLNKEDMDGAAAEFLRWNRVGSETVEGLISRRKKEKDMFEG